MKKYLLSFLAVGAMTAASAQISIISSQLQLAVTPDTSFSVNVTNVLALPTHGADQLWDYAAATGGTAFYNSLLVSDTATGFSGTTGMRFYNAGLGALSLTGSKSYFKQDNSGFYYSGFSTPEQTIDLSSITFGQDDSLYFPASINTFGTSAVQYKFPLAYGDNYTNSYTSTTPFSLTVAMAGLSNEPGELKQYITSSDSVVGWGRVIYPGSDTLDALLIKHFETRIDSVFLDGTPASPTLMGAFGLTQGDVTTFAYYDILVIGLENYAVSISTDETFSTFEGASYSTEQPDVTMNVSKVSKSALNVYPNPAANLVTIDLDGAEGNFNAQIFAVDGKSVATRSLNNGTLSLEGLHNGAYIVKVMNNDQFVGYFRVVKAN